MMYYNKLQLNYHYDATLVIQYYANHAVDVYWVCSTFRPAFLLQTLSQCIVWSQREPSLIRAHASAARSNGVTMEEKTAYMLFLALP